MCCIGLAVQLASSLIRTNRSCIGQGTRGVTMIVLFLGAHSGTAALAGRRTAVAEHGGNRQAIPRK